MDGLKGTTPGERTIRVFISSTFQDMQGERDELIKFIFPQLRNLCESRAVTWGEVDLRWGITEEQKIAGKVLPICLAEIYQCRPFFIGILGERYGWVPDEIPKQVIESEEWLAQYPGCSVTELEILHGVLKNPSMAGHAFFYFRDRAYLANLPAVNKAMFVEGPTKTETDTLDAVEAEKRAEQRRTKLRQLKDRILKSSLPVRQNYSDPKDLGQLVLRDLTQVINRLYPEGSQPSELDRESVEHLAFARSRSRVYVARAADYEKLDRHYAGNSPPLAVLGESGSGKSALLANWFLRFCEQHPLDFALIHFVGATASSSNPSAMLRRILGELNRHFGIEREIPGTPEGLRKAFVEFSHFAAAKGRFLLIVDGLNQLEDREGALDLSWLPEQIPENARIILSTLPGRPLDAITKRKYPALTVMLLGASEREKLIIDYLSLYRKELDPAQRKQISALSQTGNPLFLRAFLEEIRIYGDHQTLNQRIHQYLSSTSIEELYQKILRRYEEDYETETPGLVGDTMRLLWASRYGLSESEILDNLGSGGEPLPHAYWSPLYLSLQSSLVNRSGLIGFFHDYLRKAVETKYLPNQEAKDLAHLRLADYFDGRASGRRRTEELPWQLSAARSWRRLYDLLSDISFFQQAWDRDSLEVRKYWTQLEQQTPFRMLEAYRQVRESPHLYRNYLWSLGNLFADTGYNKESLALNDCLMEFHREWSNQDRINEAHRKLRETGRLEENFTQEDLEKVVHDNKVNYANSLIRKAQVLRDQNDLTEAMRLAKEAEELFTRLGIKDLLASSFLEQAKVLMDQGDYKESKVLLRKAEQIFREVGDLKGLHVCISNQGSVLFDQNHLNDAIKIFEEEEQLARMLANEEFIANALVHQANVWAVRRKYGKAETLYVQAEQQCREIGEKQGLASILGNRARMLNQQRKFSAALPLYQEAERISREIGERDTLASSLYGQALAFSTRKQTRHLAEQKCLEALRLYQSMQLQMEVRMCEGLMLGIRSGMTPLIKNLIAWLISVLLVASGIFLGLLNPWLWLIGAPLTLVGILIQLTRLRYVQGIMKQWLADLSKPGT